MDRRELVLDLLADEPSTNYVPAAFFMHFPEDCHAGRAAVEKHIDYFRATGMDFVKIQYEASYPESDDIGSPGEWGKIPSAPLDYYRGQLEVVEGLVEELGAEALVVQTLYSPFMLAARAVGRDRIVGHMREDPEAIQAGMQIVTDSLLGFVRECIRLGVDGFYASTQGGEAERFGSGTVFRDCIKTYDLMVWNEIAEACPFNILHVCDYHGRYDGVGQFLDYPGQVVNMGLEVGGEDLTPSEVEGMFGRPFMGGLDRFGVITTGDDDAIRSEVARLLDRASDRFILAADCTLPGETNWNHLRAATDAAHAIGGPRRGR